MVQVQITLNIMETDDKQSQIAVDILSREDATQLEVGMAKAIENLIQGTLTEIIELHGGSYSLENVITGETTIHQGNDAPEEASATTD